MVKRSGWQYGAIGLFLLVIMILGVKKNILAYMTDMGQTENQLNIGGNQIQIREEFESPGQLLPGQQYVKKVQVENVGLSDCYVRIKVVFTDSNVGQYCLLDWNMTDFIYNPEDGFHYYHDILSNGEKTSFLFSNVSVSGDFPADCTEECSILVYAESCQAEGFEYYEEAWNYWRRNQS